MSKQCQKNEAHYLVRSVLLPLSALKISFQIDFLELIWALVKITDIPLTSAHKSLSSSIGGMFCDLIAGKKAEKRSRT